MSVRLYVVTLLVTLSLFSAGSLAQKPSPRDQHRRELVEMEHAFAKAAATKGTRDAFIEFLADDGIVFQPGPVKGKKFWTDRQPRKGLLSWEPVFADVSRAADLGYTTGPWEFRPNGPEDKPVAFGQYFTIWKRQSDGSWKAVLDRGVTSEKSSGAPPLAFPKGEERFIDGPSVDVTTARTMLLRLEEEFSKASAVSARTAYASYLAEDARLLRQNAAPAIGKASASALMPENGRALTWKPVMADVSASGDLGYTYGSFEVNTRGVTLEHGSYVRLWKKFDGKWKVVADVMSPDPKE